MAGFFDTLAAGVTSPEAWTSAPPSPYEGAVPSSPYEKLTGKIDPEYLSRAREVFYSVPSISSGNADQPRVTPADWLRREIYATYKAKGFELSPESLDAAVANVFSHQVGAEEGKPAIANFSRQLLRTLKSESPVGDSENKAFAGQTLAQREGRRRDWFQDGRFMTSQGLDTQLDALRAYTMLGALEEDPELKLPMFNNAGNFLSMGGMINPGNPATLLRSFFQDVDPTTDPGAGIRHLAYLRNVHSDNDPVSARQKEALYWDRLGERARTQEGQYRSSIEGGYYWPYSYLNDVGMSRVSEDNANFLSNSDERISHYLMDRGMWGGQQGAELSHLASLVKREVPIVPEGVDPSVTREAQKRSGTLSDETHQRFIDEYPLLQERWNQYMPGTAFDVQKYSFPSPALNNLATAPAYSLDTITLGTLGASAPYTIAKHGIKALAGGLMLDLATDQPFEQSFAGTLYGASNQGDMSGYFAPYTKSNVSENPGAPGDGGQYRKKFEQEFKPTQNKNIEWLRDYYQTSHPRGELQIERNMPSPFTGARRRK